MAIPCYNSKINIMCGDCIFDEVFCAVPNTNNRYYASSYGYVYDMALGKILPTRKTKRGWYDCKIWFNDNRKTINIHRVIAMTFIGESSLTVNHIDGNKENNSIENLEYMTRIEQNWHRSRVTHSGNQIPIYCEETGDIYPSASVACEILKIPNNGHIHRLVNNVYGYKSVYGFHFKKAI